VRPRIGMIFALCALLNASAQTKTQSKPDTLGLSVQAFRSFAGNLPTLSGRIQAITLFQETFDKQASIAVLTRSEGFGWQVYVFSDTNGRGFQLEWKSGKLDYSFSVSDPAFFKRHRLDHGEAVQFSGCAQHMCPEIHSAMLYIPSKRTAYTATYDKGKISYSPKMESPEEMAYKADLDELVNAMP
jgi:hypothetical protein